MTKREMIDEILLLNRSAQPEFLAQFEQAELEDYLRHLQMIRTPRLNCLPGQYDRYFENLPTIPSGRANPAATIVTEHDDPEHELWPTDPVIDEEIPTDHLLTEAFDDELDEEPRSTTAAAASAFNGVDYHVRQGGGHD